MDNNFKSLKKRTGQALHRLGSLTQILPVPGPSKTHDSQREDEYGGKENSMPERSRVPSDVGPHGSDRLIQQNRIASGFAPVSGRRVISEPLSHPSQSTLGTADTRESPFEMRTADAPRHLEFQNAPRSRETYHNLAGVRPQTPGTPDISDLKLSATALTTQKFGDEESFDCPIDVHFPLSSNAYIHGAIHMTFVIVVDNSAYSSVNTWNRILRTILGMMKYDCFSKDDSIAIVCTHPRDADGPIVLGLGKYKAEDIMDALRKISLIRDRPVPDQLDVAIARATCILTEEWKDAGFLQENRGHVLVLTSNPRAVQVEFALNSAISRAFPVYVLCASALTWREMKSPSVSNEHVKAVIALNSTDIDAPSNQLNRSQLSNISSLMALIRTDSVPLPAKHVKVWLSIRSMAMPVTDLKGKNKSVEGSILGSFSVGSVRPGERISHNFHIDLSPLLAKYGCTDIHPDEDTWEIFQKILHQHGHRLVVYMRWAGASSQAIRGYSPCQELIDLTDAASRNGAYDELRAAYYKYRAAELLRYGKLKHPHDLLQAGADDWMFYNDDLTDCLEDLFAEAIFQERFRARTTENISHLVETLPSLSISPEFGGFARTVMNRPETPSSSAESNRMFLKATMDELRYVHTDMRDTNSPAYSVSPPAPLRPRLHQNSREVTVGNKALPALRRPLSTTAGGLSLMLPNRPDTSASRLTSPKHQARNFERLLRAEAFEDDEGFANNDGPV